jgi:hypothetical protein
VNSEIWNMAARAGEARAGSSRSERARRVGHWAVAPKSDAQHPAAESYEWLEKLRAVIGERPQNFNRVMQEQEKKLLEQLLEQALGVARKKPAPRKTAGRKTAKTGAKKRV